ncbi:MAG: VCBS repeat-containing protein [Acidobacteriaceae bacterium]
MFHRILVVLLLAGTTATLSAQSSVSFEMFADTYTVPNPNGIASGDFNNDGKPDLIECCNSTGLIFRAGNGDGSFQAPVTAATASDGAAQLVAADVNGDGKLDLVGLPAYGNYPEAPNGTGLAVWLGNGDGTFQAPQVYATTNNTDDVQVGNFFGDGRPDIAVGESGGVIDLFRNEGNGTFVFDKSINLGTGSESQMTLAAGDLNGNGVSDLAVAAEYGSAGTGALYVLWNDGKGDFTPQELDSSYIEPTVSISRLNGDGQMDILVSYTCDDTPSGMQRGPTYNPCAGFDAYYGQGGNTLYKSTLINDPGVYNFGIPFGVDINGDGYGDIVSEGGTSCYCQFGLLVWQGNANGSFQQTPQEFINNTGGNGEMTMADFARNGMMDFATSSGNDDVTELFLDSTPRPACGTYTISPSVTACQPVDNTYSPSPVRVEATSYDTTKVTAMQEYVDNKLVYSEPVNSLDTTLTEPVGSHFFVTKGWDSSGRNFVADRTVNVYDGTPGPTCPTTMNSENICLPAGTSSGSPVLILANGNTGDAVPTAAQLYIDGTLVVNNEGYCQSSGSCTGGTTYVETSQNLSAGTHQLVFKLWEAGGGVLTASKTITVN